MRVKPFYKNCSRRWGLVCRERSNRNPANPDNDRFRMTTSLWWMISFMACRRQTMYSSTITTFPEADCFTSQFGWRILPVPYIAWTMNTTARWLCDYECSSRYKKVYVVMMWCWRLKDGDCPTKEAVIKRNSVQKIICRNVTLLYNTRYR